MKPEGPRTPRRLAPPSIQRTGLWMWGVVLRGEGRAEPGVKSAEAGLLLGVRRLPSGRHALLLLPLHGAYGVGRARPPRFVYPVRCDKKL